MTRSRLLGSFLLMLSLWNCPTGQLGGVEAAIDPIRSDVTEITGAHEGEECTPTFEKDRFVQSDCRQGMVCAPDIYDISIGSCRADCQDGAKCPAGRACQRSAMSDLTLMGTFCLPVQTERDGACLSFHDANSCSDGRVCSISDTVPGSQELDITGLVCRDSCAFGQEGAEKRCGSGEFCVAATLESEPQLNPKIPGKPLPCAVPQCQGSKDIKDCPCKLSEGFSCMPAIGDLVGVCVRQAGICAEPTPWATANNFGAGGYNGKRCNERTAHRFCDTRPFDGVKSPGQVSCVEFPDSNGEGFCFGFCSKPSLDLNGDGKITRDELALKSACPKDQACKVDMARSIGMVVHIPGDQGLESKKACNPKKCEAKKPCPAECGPGDAECLSYKTDDGIASFCGAPYGNCEPS